MLAKAREDFIEEMNKIEVLDQCSDHAALKGLVYKRKTLNPRRVKGLGAFATTWGIYSYLPYLSVYFGSTFPILAACTAGLYGMFAFSESQIVNTIKVIEEGDHKGKLLINIGLSPFASKNIIADIKDIQSVVSLGNDDIGEDDRENNVISIQSYIDETSGQNIDELAYFTLPGDAFRDKMYMDWILSDKSGEESLLGDYQDLMH